MQVFAFYMRSQYFLRCEEQYKNQGIYLQVNTMVYKSTRIQNPSPYSVPRESYPMPPPYSWLRRAYMPVTDILTIVRIQLHSPTDRHRSSHVRCQARRQKDLEMSRCGKAGLTRRFDAILDALGIQIAQQYVVVFFTLRPPTSSHILRNQSPTSGILTTTSYAFPMTLQITYHTSMDQQILALPCSDLVHPSGSYYYFLANLSPH